MFGGPHHVLLALQKPGHKGVFSICRPNTGDAFFEMEKHELDAKYLRAQAEDVQEEWDTSYESSKDVCMHGASCRDPAQCQVGGRARHKILEIRLAVEMTLGCSAGWIVG